MKVRLENGPRIGEYAVRDKKSRLWLEHLCGSVSRRTYRLGLALYTYSRTEGDLVIFRYRRCRDI